MGEEEEPRVEETEPLPSSEEGEGEGARWSWEGVEGQTWCVFLEQLLSTLQELREEDLGIEVRVQWVSPVSHGDPSVALAAAWLCGGERSSLVREMRGREAS